jgi:hypothetical protein
VPWSEAGQGGLEPVLRASALLCFFFSESRNKFKKMIKVCRNYNK